MFSALAAASLFLSLTYAIKNWLNIRQYPPGPGYSFSGNFAGQSPEQTGQKVLELKTQYGDVCSTFIFNKLAVYLNTHAAIKQAYVTHGDDTAGRLQLNFPSPLVRAPGIITSTGAVWQEHRRFALTALRNFGLGRNRAETIIQTELDYLVSEFKSHNARAFNPRLTLNRVTSNVISRLVFGERAGCESEYEQLYYILRDNFELVTPNNFIVVSFVVRFLPWLAIPGTRMHGFIERGKRNINQLAEFVKKKLEEHKQTFHPDKEEQDLIDSYLAEQYRLEKEQPGQSHTFTTQQLLRVILEFFAAGTETTSNMIRWGIFLLAHHPNIQEKAQQEIDDVLQGRTPATADKTRLPYTNAVIMEVMRYASLTPLGGPPHVCLRSFRLNDHVIPEGAVMFANLFAVHRDQSIWPDAHNFNPANFLHVDNNGHTHTRNEQYLIPFDIGKRSCLGESLAKQETFILLTGLLQRFKFVKPAGFPALNDIMFSINLRAAKDFEVVALVRED